MKARHRYHAPFRNGTELILAKLTVNEFKEESDGTRIYSVEAVEMEKPATFKASSISENRRNYNRVAGFEKKLQRRMEEVKSEGGSFSLGPADVAGIMSGNALARITDPHRRTHVMARIARDFDAMRLQIDRIMSLSSIRRSKGDLRREAAAREDLRAEELIGDVHRRFGELLADEDLVKIKSQPVHAYLADPDSPLRGRLMSKAAAIRQHPDMFQLHRAGDYDGSDGVSRSVFGGQRMPDQAAQDLYDEGLIPAPTPDALWEALLTEQRSVASMKELLQKAQEQIREAKAQAKQEANEWLATQSTDQETNFSDKEEIRRSLRMLDAILLALPPRGPRENRRLHADFHDQHRRGPPRLPQGQTRQGRQGPPGEPPEELTKVNIGGGCLTKKTGQNRAKWQGKMIRNHPHFAESVSVTSVSFKSQTVAN